jgi:hypothetical protein
MPKMQGWVLHFGNIPHMWALPIVKHELKAIMSLNIGRS